MLSVLLCLITASDLVDLVWGIPSLENVMRLYIWSRFSVLCFKRSYMPQYLLSKRDYNFSTHMMSEAIDVVAISDWFSESCCCYSSSFVGLCSWLGVWMRVRVLMLRAWSSERASGRQLLGAGRISAAAAGSGGQWWGGRSGLRLWNGGARSVA